MFISRWIIAIAFGLTLAANSGQAQEQTEDAQGNTGTQQGPTQALPIPFPIEIVEDQAATNARQNSEKEATQREVEDLIAQQGMNAATQAMNEATQAMATYSWYQTIAVCIGTGLLIVTLILTWLANKSAMKAVEVTEKTGKDQLRAYLHFPSAVITQNEETGQFRATIEVKNYGQTPARDIRKATMQGVGTDIKDTVVYEDFESYEPAGDLGPQQSNTYHFGISTEVMTEINGDADGETSCQWVGLVHYTDIYGRQFKSGFAFMTNPGERIQHRILHACRGGNYTT